MEHRQLGHSGLRVSRLALGTMGWGEETGTEAAAEVLAAFTEAGGTLVDTADVYGGGAAETTVGELLDKVVPRDQVVLATKAVARREDGPFGGGASRGALLAALDGSLRRLGVDHVDLWQLHAWDGHTPLTETLAAVDHAVTSGRVRYAGVSNYAGWQLATAATTQHHRRPFGGTPIISAQVEYSLVERGVEREVVPAAEHHGVGLLAWAPLGRGVLTGKYRHATPPDSRGASERMANYVEHHRNDRTARIVQAVATAAEGLGVSPLEVALAWVRDRPGVTASVVGARTRHQLTTSLNTEHLHLPLAIRAALDDISSPPVGYPEHHLVQ
ncbi:aldo/keto reductase [Actinoalloteichus sp. AHMU CJ021]|uniref:aldo/keto reductase n=1 Tax=Actinoalloteichus TaxID=65496 RepID=UPI000CA080C3|nr:aldo/keto reductase [Actinoalloteichus sp. AHMU CJ021]